MQNTKEGPPEELKALDAIVEKIRKELAIDEWGHDADDALIYHVL